MVTGDNGSSPPQSVVNGLQEHLPPLTCGLAQRQVGLAQLLGSIQPKGTQPSSCPIHQEGPARLSYKAGFRVHFS